MHEELIEKARILIEALPYIRRFRGQTVVIKYGGHAMKDEALKIGFAQDVVLLSYVGIRPVIIHGGGPQIGQALAKMGIESRFVHGLRVTTPEAMAVVEMVLAGQVNKEIAALIQSAGGQAVGISGKDGRLITARKLDLAQHVGEEAEDLPDIGLVGQVEHVNARVIEALMSDGFIPVIAPVGLGMGGETYNINADTVAAEVAVALQASKLVLLTDVPGVQDSTGALLSSLSCTQADGLIKDGQITGGMVPKIKGAVAVVHRGVGKVHIIDGRLPHALLLEIFTDKGIGTEVIG